MVSRSAKDKTVSAELKTAWNEKGLYIAVTVHKAGFHPAERSTARLWDGDSLQIAFDPLRNARKRNMKYDGDDFEYFFGMFKGGPVVYRARASLSLYDSLDKATGELTGNEVPLAVKSSIGKTVYEMMFVPRTVSPFKLKAGSSMCFNLIVNLNDGKKRLGWLELTPGIGQYKNPGEFIDLVLLP